MRTNVKQAMDRFINKIISNQYKKLIDNQINENDRQDAYNNIACFQSVKDIPIDLNRLWDKNHVS